MARLHSHIERDVTIEIGAIHDGMYRVPLDVFKWDHQSYAGFRGSSIPGAEQAKFA
jgi:hypothetical protein